MLRLVLGLAKGAVIGGAVGYGAFAAGLRDGWTWLAVGLAGALVGLLVGRPVWRHLRDSGATLWTPLLKGLFGFGVTVGLYFLTRKIWGGIEVVWRGESVNVLALPFAAAGAFGALYGGFVEVDDASDSKAKSKGSGKAA